MGNSDPDEAATATTVSRRTFAKTSVAAGAAAVALPTALRGDTLTGAAPTAAGKVSAANRAALPAPRVSPPEHVIGYGGVGAHPSAVPATSTRKSYPGGWQPGRTIAGEYYFDEEHYLKDEAFLRESQWMFADVACRIPTAGDYFVFEYGGNDSVIVVRGNGGDVKAFHNVCRHRGSRLCRHDGDAVPGDPRLSVKQLGSNGSSPVFRCPYHAWTYDTEGSLIYAYGMQEDFDPADNGLIPCYLRNLEGNIFLNLSQAAEPPDFDEQVGGLRPTLEYYGTAELKVAVRQKYSISGNWKLALENFQECYHCGPAHKSLVTTHNYDMEGTPEQHAQRAASVRAWVKPEGQRNLGGGFGGGMGMGSGGGSGSETYGVFGRLNSGYMTGSVDGKPLAPLLPNIDDWTYGTRIAATRFFSYYAQCYDDHVAIARFTPRGPALTDCELIWLVHPDAVEGRDYDRDELMALWHITIQEDIWVVENNQQGVRSGSYRSGRYSTAETGPSNFAEWYMEQIVG